MPAQPLDYRAIDTGSYINRTPDFEISPDGR